MTEKAKNISVRMSGKERRMQILQAAIKLFAKQGFSGTTTKKIAEKVHVSEAMVFKHFANKDELYRAILDKKACSETFKNTREEVDKFIEERNDFGFFNALALKLFKEHKNDTSFLRLMIYSALEEHELAKAFVENLLKQIYDHIGNYIRLRQREGRFKNFEPRVAVRAFSGMFVHHSLSNLLWDKGQRILKISDEKAAEEFTIIF